MALQFRIELMKVEILNLNWAKIWKSNNDLHKNHRCGTSTYSRGKTRVPQLGNEAIIDFLVETTWTFRRGCPYYNIAEKYDFFLRLVF